MLVKLEIITIHTCIVYTCALLSYNEYTVQNPRHKCDWETRMTTDKKIIADYT